MEKNQVSETVSQAASKADDYESFLSDSGKNEKQESQSEIGKSNGDNLVTEELEKEDQIFTANDMEGKLEERKVKYDTQINRPNNLNLLFYEFIQY